MVKVYIPLLILIVLLNTACTQVQTPEAKPLQKAKSNDIKDVYISLMEKQNQIWSTEDEKKVKDIIDQIYSNQNIKNELYHSYQKAKELDQGIEYSSSNYDIRIVNSSESAAELNVSASVQGYPISLKTGLRRKQTPDDFSFYSHNFKLKKEMGTWKIDEF